MSAPIVTLNNGIRVANFSSPHPFSFSTGEVLEACSPERANTLMLKQEEVIEPSPCGRFDNIKLRFSMSEIVKSDLLMLEEDESIDVILVPFPVMEAIKASGLKVSKARVCRVADRVTKTIFSNKFCV